MFIRLCAIAYGSENLLEMLLYHNGLLAYIIKAVNIMRFPEEPD